MADKAKNVNQVKAVNDDKDLDTVSNKQNKEKEVKIGKKEAKQKKKREKKRRKGIIFVPIIIAILLIGALAGIIRFNPFNIREQYLRSTIDKIPFISVLIPQEETDSTDQVQAQPSASVVELQTKIDELYAELEQSRMEMQTLLDQNDSNLQEMARLQEVEEQQIQFKSDKAEFDKMIAENNPSAYAKFYESIAPDNAEILYKEAVVEVEKSKELKKYINDIDAMDDSNAAKALEELIPSDMTLVVSILKNLTNDKSGSVLSAMDTINAASVIKAMSPS